MYWTNVAKIGRSGFGRFAPSCSPIRMFQTSCRSGSFHTACCAGMTKERSARRRERRRYGGHDRRREVACLAGRQAPAQVLDQPAAGPPGLAALFMHDVEREAHGPAGELGDVELL